MCIRAPHSMKKTVSIICLCNELFKNQNWIHKIMINLYLFKSVFNYKYGNTWNAALNESKKYK